MPFVKRGSKSKRISLGVKVEMLNWKWSAHGILKARCPVGFDGIRTQKDVFSRIPPPPSDPSVALLSVLLHLSPVPSKCCSRFH